MTQSLNHLLESHQDEAREDILFFAGTGHSELKRLAMLDKQKVYEDIKYYANLLTKETLDILLEDNLADADIINIMTGYLKIFIEPIEFGRNSKALDINQIDPFKTSPSPAFVMVESIINLLRQSHESSRKKAILEKLLINLCKNKIENITSLYESYQNYDPSVKNEFEMKKITYSISLILNESGNYYQLPDNSFGFIGVMLIYGKVVPITKVKNLEGKEFYSGKLDYFTEIIFS